MKHSDLEIRFSNRTHTKGLWHHRLTRNSGGFSKPLVSVFRSTSCLAWFIFVSAFSFGAQSHAEIPSDKPEIKIEIVSQLQDMSTIAVNRAHLSPQDEFIHFSSILKKELSKLAPDQTYSIERFPVMSGSDQLEFVIYIQEWEIQENGEIRTRLFAKYQLHQEPFKIGSFRGKSHVIATPMQSLRERQFEEAMLEACGKLAKKIIAITEDYHHSSSGGQTDDQK